MQNWRAAPHVGSQKYRVQGNALLPSTIRTYSAADGTMTGRELARERRRVGLTQVAMAERVGVTSNTVARWERGEMRIAEPQIVETALKHEKERNMSAYERTVQLGRERKVLALALLKCCVDYLLKFGRDSEFHAKAVLGGMPVINMRSLTAMGLIEKVSASRRHVYYRMPDSEGVERALRELNVPLG
jgi:transcriptional regulator with XRE-family HTH domain